MAGHHVWRKGVGGRYKSPLRLRTTRENWIVLIVLPISNLDDVPLQIPPSRPSSTPVMLYQRRPGSGKRLVSDQVPDKVDAGPDPATSQARNSFSAKYSPRERPKLAFACGDGTVRGCHQKAAGAPTSPPVKYCPYGMHRAQVRWPRGKGETRCQRRVGRLGHAGTCKSGRSRARPSVTMIRFPIPPPPPSNPSMAGRRASCWQRSRSMRRSPTFSPVAPVAPALGGYRGSGHGTGARHPFDWSKPHRLARSTADLLRKPRPGPSRVCEPCRAHAFVC